MKAESVAGEATAAGGDGAAGSGSGSGNGTAAPAPDRTPRDTPAREHAGERTPTPGQAENTDDGANTSQERAGSPRREDNAGDPSRTPTTTPTPTPTEASARQARSSSPADASGQPTDADDAQDTTPGPGDEAAPASTLEADAEADTPTDSSTAGSHADADTGADPDAGADPHPSVEPDPGADTDARGDAGTDKAADADASDDASNHTGTGTPPDTATDAGGPADDRAGGDADTEAEADVDASGDAGARGADAEAEADAIAKADADASDNADADVDAEADADASDTPAGVNADRDAGAHPDSAEPRAGTPADADPSTIAAAEPDPSASADPDPSASADPDPSASADPDPDAAAPADADSPEQASGGSADTSRDGAGEARPPVEPPQKQRAPAADSATAAGARTEPDAAERGADHADAAGSRTPADTDAPTDPRTALRSQNDAPDSTPAVDARADGTDSGTPKPEPEPDPKGTDPASADADATDPEAGAADAATADPAPAPAHEAPEPADDPERTSTFLALKDHRSGRAPAAPAPARPAVASPAHQAPPAPMPPLDLLAELTNTAPPPETPRRTITRRVKVWTPIVLLLGAAAVGGQLLRPLPAPQLVANSTTYALEGSTQIPWPAKGQAAVRVPGAGDVGSFGEQKPVPTASVAKVMTAYVILKGHPLRKNEPGPRIEVDAAAVADGTAEDESRIEGLKAGTTFSQQDMLKMLMIPSGNNIARLLARWDTGTDSTDAFVAKMNAAAKELGMNDTTYTDPSGLDAGTVSTAADQIKLGEAVMKEEAFRAVVAMPNATIEGLPKPINNNNDNLLLANGLSIKGIKTGSSTPAGGTLLWAAYKTVGSETQLILGAMMEQRVDGPDPNATKALGLVKENSRKVIEAVRSALNSTTVIRKGELVGHLSDGLGGSTPLVATKDVNVIGVPGQELRLSLAPGSKAVPHEAKAGTEVGVLTVGEGDGAKSVPVAVGSTLDGPSFGARVTRLS
ncbi:serine hydrolase [Streptomyces sp. NPDC048383]|uniref:serine hydrolase n=1 Tax=Streptomyces sp. NPDC048383 TaxID=3155386 RepID=UPI0034390F01